MTLVLGCKTPFILFFFFLHFFEGLTTSVAIKTLLCIANFDKKYITVAFFLSPLSIPTFSHLKNITEHLFHNKCIILTRFSIVLLVSCTIDVIKQDVLSGETNVITETGDSWFNCQRLCLPEKSGYGFQMQYGSIGWSVGATLKYSDIYHINGRLVHQYGPLRCRKFPGKST